ncbi:MAG: NAD-dependent epimerase/dehydratase family protein [Methanomicrobiales archaeon]|nr:NAD-dependent epimerase/dehydratase family protein [Methanomicrobiales archaeon]
MTGKRVFVTGAHGFIGSYITRLLVQNGYDVGILVRPQSDCSRIRDCLDRLTVCRGDIRNGSDVEKAVAGFAPDSIIHLVTYYAVEHRPDEIGVMLDTNVRGMINLLEAARNAGTGSIVNASTCAVYRETGELLHEDATPAPQNLYALTKLHSEEACDFYADAYGINAVSLRLFPPYGPGDHERRLIPYVIRTMLKGESPMLTTGNQKWDFVYVTDIARAFVAAAGYGETHPGHTVINVGTGEAVSVRDIVSRLAALCGYTGELAFGSVPHRRSEVWFNSADIAKSSELLGWRPKIGLSEGLEKTCRWFAAPGRNDAEP